MQVSEIMTRSLDFIAPDATVQEAAVLMGELDVGALPVGTPEAIEGILTDRDILFRVVADGQDSAAVRVHGVMSRTIFTCRETDSLATALDIMGSYHVRRLPVLDAAGTVAGMLTLSDLSRVLLVESGTMRTALAELSDADKGD